MLKTTQKLKSDICLIQFIVITWMCIKTYEIIH